MRNLDEIKQLMAEGETVQADTALKELLAAEPNNLQAKMLYGTCRQLLGDEETFKRIHDELAPEMDRLEKKEPKAETLSLWKKYHALWVTLISGGLVLLGLGSAVVYFGRVVSETVAAATTAMTGYRGPQYNRNAKVYNQSVESQANVVKQFDGSQVTHKEGDK